MDFHKTNNLSVLLFFLLTVIGSGVMAQDGSVSKTNGNGGNSIRGKITDLDTGEPLMGASIYLSDIKMGAITDLNGDFELRGMPSGNHILEISFLGYTSIAETLFVQGEIRKDFTLSMGYIEADAVVVTGVSSATSKRKTPVSVDVMETRALNKLTSTNLIDAVTKIPGISQITTGAAISKPVIRGLGANRVVVVNDGIRQEGQQWGDEHGIEVDEYNIGRVEVLKGPASLMYGSDAIAGVINFISFEPAQQGETKGNIFGTYQTNNGLRGLHMNIYGNENGILWGVNGTYKAAEDYKNKYDGHVFNSRFNEKDFGGYVGIRKNWGTSRVSVSKFNQEVGLVRGARDSISGNFTKSIENNGSVEEVVVEGSGFHSTNPDLPYQQIKHLKIATENNIYFGSDRMVASFAYQRNQRLEFGNILEPGVAELFFDLRTLNFNVRYHFAEKNNWKTSIGSNGMGQKNRNLGEEALIPEYGLFDTGVFLYTQRSWEKLTVSGGIRYDLRKLETDGHQIGNETKFRALNRDFSNYSGSIGASYTASKRVLLKANVARGYRAPNIPELTSNGAHEGTNRFEFGNPNLKSESSLQLDTGIEVVTPHLAFGASAFYNSIDNFIYYRKMDNAMGNDSIRTDGNEEFLVFGFDQNKAKLFGAEVKVDIHPHPLDWLHLESVFSFVRGILDEAQDGSNNLPFIPAARLVNTVKAEFRNKGRAIRNNYVELELDNTFAQNNAFTGFNTETDTPGYSILSLGFGGEVMVKEKVLFAIYFAGNNLFDVAYQSHLSRLKYTDINHANGRQGVYNMGRNFSIKVNVPLGL